MSVLKRANVFYFVLSLVLVVAFVWVALYRLHISHLPMVVMSTPPAPVTGSYTTTPAPNCGPKCEWRDSEALGVWTLVDSQRVIARVFKSNAYPDYFDVSDGYGIRHQLSEWGTLESAKAAAEDLAKKKPNVSSSITYSGPEK